MKESKEMHLKSTINESPLSTAGAVPPSPMGKGVLSIVDNHRDANISQSKKEL